MQVTNEPCENTANAIVAQAATDYRNALNGIGYDPFPADKVIEECEKFFRSIWCQMLTKVPGEYLIERLKKEHQAKLEKEQLCE